MSKQVEITEPTPLLDDNGVLAAPGYCKRNLYIYERDKVAAKWRLKEWDFYQISDGKYVVQVNFANITIGAAATASVFELAEGKPINKKSGMGLSLFPGHNKHVLPTVSDTPNRFEFRKGKVMLCYEVSETERHISYKDGKLDIDIVAAIPSGSESISIVTPFKNKRRFFLTDKINCMPVTKCDVKYKGATLHDFDLTDTYMVLDWGRGAWQYSNYWYWANLSTRLDDGKLFGFELTWGIGLDDYASETMLFYDGKAHKIGRVDLEVPPDGRWMEPWHFISDDGRLDLTMTPYCDNYNPLNLGLIKFSGHQVHGIWNGYVVLDDGTRIEVKDKYAFCEKIYNRW